MKFQGKYRVVEVIQRNSGFFMPTFDHNGICIEGQSGTKAQAEKQAKRLSNTPPDKLKIFYYQ